MEKNEIFYNIVMYSFIEMGMRIYLFSFMIILIIFMFLGGFLNIAVVLANGGRMPVYTDRFYINNSDYFSYDDPSDVRLHRYADIFVINDYIFFSVGDIIVFGSLLSFIFVGTILLIKNKKHRKEIDDLIKEYETADNQQI